MTPNFFPIRAPAEAVPFVVDFMPIRQNRTVFRIQVIPIAVRWIEQPTRLQVAVCIKIEASLANAARVGKKYPSVSRISAVLVFALKLPPSSKMGCSGCGTTINLAALYAFINPVGCSLSCLNKRRINALPIDQLAVFSRLH